MTDLQRFVGLRGLTIVTGRPGAGKTNAVLEAGSDAVRADRTVFALTEKPPGDWSGASRYSAPVDRGFHQVREELLGIRRDLIVIDEVFDAERAAFATHCALTGSAVLAVVSAGDVLEALDWFTELATRDEATELGVYAALTAVVRVGADPDVFMNTPEASRALLDGRPSAEVRAAGSR